MIVPPAQLQQQACNFGLIYYQGDDFNIRLSRMLDLTKAVNASQQVPDGA
jgi:hypothetical protein